MQTGPLRACAGAAAVRRWRRRRRRRARRNVGGAPGAAAARRRGAGGAGAPAQHRRVALHARALHAPVPHRALAAQVRPARAPHLVTRSSAGTVLACSPLACTPCVCRCVHTGWSAPPRSLASPSAALGAGGDESGMAGSYTGMSDGGYSSLPQARPCLQDSVCTARSPVCGGQPPRPKRWQGAAAAQGTGICLSYVMSGKIRGALSTCAVRRAWPLRPPPCPG